MTAQIGGGEKSMGRVWYWEGKKSASKIYSYDCDDLLLRDVWIWMLAFRLRAFLIVSNGFSVNFVFWIKRDLVYLC